VRIIVAKSKEVKPGCNLAESSKESYGSNRAVLPMMMMMMMMLLYPIRTQYPYESVYIARIEEEF
jgi:hypothetical protein